MGAIEVARKLGNIAKDECCGKKKKEEQDTHKKIKDCRPRAEEEATTSLWETIPIQDRKRIAKAGGIPIADFAPVKILKEVVIAYFCQEVWDDEVESYLEMMTGA